MGIDRTYAERALADLAQLTTFLSGLGVVTGARLEGDLGLRLAVLHALQLSIQIVLDLGAHILASLHAAPIEEYADIGARLVDKGVVAAHLGAALIPMARFRNLLVHQYAQIDLARVAELVTSRLPDFDAFGRAILEFLDRETALIRT